MNVGTFSMGKIVQFTNILVQKRPWETSLLSLLTIQKTTQNFATFLLKFLFAFFEMDLNPLQIYFILDIYIYWKWCVKNAESEKV